MLIPNYGADLPRLTFLLHRLRYPDAPPLLLTDTPADLRLVAFAADIHRLLPKSCVSMVLADLQAHLIGYGERGSLSRSCAHCHGPLADRCEYFCGAPCRNAFYVGVA